MSKDACVHCCDESTYDLVDCLWADCVDEIDEQLHEEYRQQDGHHRYVSGWI